MAWGGPVEPALRRASWKREIRRGPRPGDESPFSQESAVRDRVLASAFGTQVAFAIAFSVVVVAATVFYAQYSGAVRWLLGIVVVAAGGASGAGCVGEPARGPGALWGVRRGGRAG